MESVRRLGLIRTSIVCVGLVLMSWGTLGLVGSASIALAGEETSMSSEAPHAILKTKFGEMEIVFFPELAPKHVESFMKLAKSGFYNGTIFHRVIPGFMIQGGDPNTKDPSKVQSYGTGGPGYTLPAEFSKVAHEKGILSAARTADPNSAGSQFFIMADKASHLDGQYTIFGEVVKGLDIIDKIVSQARDPRDNPLERIEMTIEVVE